MAASKKKRRDTPPTLSLYEHDSLEDVVDRVGELLADMGYELRELEVDEEDDETDLYARFVVEEAV